MSCRPFGRPPAPEKFKNSKTSVEAFYSFPSFYFLFLAPFEDEKPTPSARPSRRERVPRASLPARSDFPQTNACPAPYPHVGTRVYFFQNFSVLSFIFWALFSIFCYFSSFFNLLCIFYLFIYFYFLFSIFYFSIFIFFTPSGPSTGPGLGSTHTFRSLPYTPPAHARTRARTRARARQLARQYAFTARFRPH